MPIRSHKMERTTLTFGDCDANAQSPINITGSTADNSLNALAITYEASLIILINNSHAIEFEYEAGSSIELNGTAYELKQFHFHEQSEHTIDGKRYPLAVHLVHQSEAGAYVVIGVLFKAGSESSFLANFSDNLPAIKDEEYHVSDTLNAIDLIPVNAGYYNYRGSLTTPPCSETVN
jgi:carbonic anhydrase